MVSLAPRLEPLVLERRGSEYRQHSTSEPLGEEVLAFRLRSVSSSEGNPFRRESFFVVF